MGADAFVVYFGVRFTVQSDEEVEGLERRVDPRLSAARKAGLRTYWGRPTDGDPYFLLVGHEVGKFGIENTISSTLNVADLQTVTDGTSEKLRQAGFDLQPAFHFQVVGRY